MKKMLAILSAVLMTGAFLIPSAHAQDTRARMKQRIPQIAELKKSGVIGEDSKGYLAFVNGRGNPQADAVVKAENADRKTVYAYIAKKENVSVDVVASQRAAKLAQIAKSGEYIQKNGKWVRK